MHLECILGAFECCGCILGAFSGAFWVGLGGFRVHLGALWVHLGCI